MGSVAPVAAAAAEEASKSADDLLDAALDECRDEDMEEEEPEADGCMEELPETDADANYDDALDELMKGKGKGKFPSKDKGKQGKVKKDPQQIKEENRLGASLRRFARSEEAAAFPNILKLHRGTAKQKKELLQQWYNSNGKPEDVEAKIKVKISSTKDSDEVEKKLTIKQMVKEGFSKFHGCFKFLSIFSFLSLSHLSVSYCLFLMLIGTRV